MVFKRLCYPICTFSSWKGGIHLSRKTMVFCVFYQSDHICLAPISCCGCTYSGAEYLLTLSGGGAFIGTELRTGQCSILSTHLLPSAAISTIRQRVGVSQLFMLRLQISLKRKAGLPTGLDPIASWLHGRYFGIFHAADITKPSQRRENKPWSPTVVAKSVFFM